MIGDNERLIWSLKYISGCFQIRIECQTIAGGFQNINIRYGNMISKC